MGFFEQLKNWFRSDRPMPEVAEPGTSEHAPAIAIAVERRKRQRVDAREGTRVLIVDDSKTICTVLRKFLRSAGYDTIEALDAESGLEIMKQQPVDLVFLDIMLPGMNGFAALRSIRRDPNSRDIPVIMMSGNEQAMEQFFGTRIGADDFMKKPFSRHEVFFRIERLLDDNHVPRRIVRATAAQPAAEAQPA